MDIVALSLSSQAILREELAILGKRLQVREDDDRIAAAEAVLSGDDTEAEARFNRIKEIVGIRKAVSLSLIRPARIAIDAGAEAPMTPSALNVITLSARGLTVTAGGTKISGYTYAGVFANAIQAIGCDRVAALNLTLNYLPLVSKELHKLAHQRYNMQVERRGEWYIVTHASTQRKRELISRICRQLGLSLIVEKCGSEERHKAQPSAFSAGVQCHGIGGGNKIACSGLAQVDFPGS